MSARSLAYLQIERDLVDNVEVCRVVPNWVDGGFVYWSGCFLCEAI